MGWGISRLSEEGIIVVNLKRGVQLWNCFKYQREINTYRGKSIVQAGSCTIGGLQFLKLDGIKKISCYFLQTPENVPFFSIWIQKPNFVFFIKFSMGCKNKKTHNYMLFQIKLLKKSNQQKQRKKVQNLKNSKFLELFASGMWNMRRRGQCRL